LVLVTPALTFLVANVLKFELGIPFLYDALSPVIAPATSLPRKIVDVTVVLGPVVALVVSVVPLLRLGLRRQNDLLVGTVAVRLSWLHLVVAAVSALAIAAIGLYLLAENLPCILGRQLYC
jgi:hypothetical protein